MGNLLAAYDPVDVEAYRRLQQETLLIGYLHPVQVKVWICSEQDALELAAGRRKPKAAAAFLSKKV